MKIGYKLNQCEIMFPSVSFATLFRAPIVQRKLH